MSSYGRCEVLKRSSRGADLRSHQASLSSPSNTNARTFLTPARADADARCSREFVFVSRIDGFAARGRRPLGRRPRHVMLLTSGAKVSVEWTGVERRRVTRKTVDQIVMLSLSGDATVTPCAMRNLSVLGAGILLEDISIPSTNFDLSFDEFRTSFACRLVWHRDAFAGLEFVH